MVFKLLVDLNDSSVEEDIYSLRDAEAQAYQARCGGKLAPTLYTRLQTLDDDDELPVAVWAAAGPGQTMTEQQEAVYAVLAARYPEAEAALQRSGTPMDVDDPVLAQQIAEEYHILMAERMVQRTQPLIDELEGRGFAILACPGMPSFATVLPKSAIIELGQHDGVTAVYLIDAEEQTELESAIPSDRVPAVWDRGYDGTGVTIAILERGNVDWDNSFLNHIFERLVGIDGETDHATGVASVAASFDGTYTGVAPGASILSAGTDDTEAGAVYALCWAIMEQRAPIVNFSAGFDHAGNQVEWIDRAFDYWARYNKNLIVNAAGNTGDSIINPGRGWNVFTVGAYNDQNNADWPDDMMREASAYINPVSDHGDREKPEVVAVGGSITRRGMNDVIDTTNGTSLSAPQVAGLGALLIHRDSMLEFWPEASHAIIMASANHNITGTSIIRFYDPVDERDGAGAINADLADQIAQSFAAPDETCYSSCWGVDFIHADTVSLERNFYAERGDMVRVAVSWWSHADSEEHDYSFDRLDTDLDLFLQRPDGAYSDISISHDNNYEMVEIMARQSGLYTIRVDKVGFNEPSNSVGIALARFPAPYHVHLPVVMKD